MTALLTNRGFQVFVIVLAAIAAISTLMAVNVLSSSDGKAMLSLVIGVGIGIPVTTSPSPPVTPPG